ncbi:hypothetical protein HK096_005448, partial [Nowakowskiella sp. JEL0078]
MNLDHQIDEIHDYVCQYSFDDYKNGLYVNNLHDGERSTESLPILSHKEDLEAKNSQNNFLKRTVSLQLPNVLKLGKGLRRGSVQVHSPQNDEFSLVRKKRGSILKRVFGIEKTEDDEKERTGKEIGKDGKLKKKFSLRAFSSFERSSKRIEKQINESTRTLNDDENRNSMSLSKCQEENYLSSIVVEKSICFNNSVYEYAFCFHPENNLTTSQNVNFSSQATLSSSPRESASGSQEIQNFQKIGSFPQSEPQRPGICVDELVTRVLGPRARASFFKFSHHNLKESHKHFPEHSQVGIGFYPNTEFYPPLLRAARSKTWTLPNNLGKNFKFESNEGKLVLHPRHPKAPLQENSEFKSKPIEYSTSRNSIILVPRRSVSDQTSAKNANSISLVYKHNPQELCESNLDYIAFRERSVSLALRPHSKLTKSNAPWILGFGRRSVSENKTSIFNTREADYLWEETVGLRV